MMLVLCCFLLLLSHLSHIVLSVRPPNCQNNQYAWPSKNPTFCCSKCAPGSYLVKRCDQVSVTECKECERNYYMDKYNNELECRRCSSCTKDYMVYEQTCNKFNDSKCGCKSQYTCNNNQCDFCIKIPPTVPTTTKTTMVTVAQVTIPAKTNAQTTPNQESVWITLSLCCACVCVLLTCFILISRHTSACGRIIWESTDSFWSFKKSLAVSSQCTEDEEVSMPVQEVCDKTEV